MKNICHFTFKAVPPPGSG